MIKVNNRTVILKLEKLDRKSQDKNVKGLYVFPKKDSSQRDIFPCFSRYKNKTRLCMR